MVHAYIQTHTHTHRKHTDTHTHGYHTHTRENTHAHTHTQRHTHTKTHTHDRAGRFWRPISWVSIARTHPNTHAHTGGQARRHEPNTHTSCQPQDHRQAHRGEVLGEYCTHTSEHTRTNIPVYTNNRLVAAASKVLCEYHTHSRIHGHARTETHIHTHTHTYTHTESADTHTHTHEQTLAHITCMFCRGGVASRVFGDRCTHTNTHTHTHTHTWVLPALHARSGRSKRLLREQTGGKTPLCLPHKLLKIKTIESTFLQNQNQTCTQHPRFVHTAQEKTPKKQEMFFQTQVQPFILSTSSKICISKSFVSQCISTSKFSEKPQCLLFY